MRTLYEEAFVGSRDTATPALGSISDEMFAKASAVLKESFEHAASMGKLAYHEVMSSIPSEREAKSKCPTLTKELIIRCHGLPQGTTRDCMELAPIWSDYETAMKNWQRP